MENNRNANALFEALKNKYVQESPGLFNIDTLPSTYGKAYQYTPQQTEAPDIVVDEMADKEEETQTDTRSFGEKLSDAYSRFWRKDPIHQRDSELGEKMHELHEAIQSERLQTKLKSQKGYLADGEAKWLPQLKKAEEYLNALNLIENSHDQILTQEQKEAVSQINQMRPEIMEYAKTNPYLQDIFYNTTPYTGKKGGITLSMQLKTGLNEIRDRNVLDFNPFNNISVGIAQGIYNQEELEGLAAANDRKYTTAKKQELLKNRIEEATKEYNDKTADIQATETVLKKGNWLYDPKYLTPSQKQKFQETELSLTDPSSWFYNLSHIGSSLSEAEMMMLQTGVSLTANAAARTAVVKGALGLLPQSRLAIALSEMAINLWLARYYRQSETSAEVFDNYNQNVINGVEDGDIDIRNVISQYTPQLEKLGYDTKDWGPDEILETAFAQGLRTNDAKFNKILDDAYIGLEQVRATNDALSYSDYLETIPFSYGGKLLWDKASKAIYKPFAKGTERALMYGEKGAFDVNRNIMQISTPGEQIADGFQKLVDKRLLKNAEELTVKQAADKARKSLQYKALASFAGRNLATMYAEGMEEGVQEAVGQAYQAGIYDEYGTQTPSAYEGFTNMLHCGLDAQLAYLGWSNKNYLNTDEQLKNSMNVGAYIGLIMPFFPNAAAVRDVSKQSRVAKILETYAAKNEDHGEKDVKMDALLSAMKTGKDLTYITNYLNELKKFKQTGVTDEMIDADSQMAVDLYSVYQSSITKQFLKDLGYNKKGTERDRIAKLAVHLMDRRKDQNNAVSAINDAVQQKENEIPEGQDVAFEAYIDALLDEDQRYKELQTKDYTIPKDWSDEDILNNPEAYNTEIQQRTQDAQKLKENTLNDYRKKFSGFIKQLQQMQARHDAVNEAVSETTQRIEQLQEIANRTGQKMDLSGIVSIAEYLKQLGETYDKEFNDILKKAGVENIESLQRGTLYEELFNLYKSQAIANGALTNINSQLNAVLQGQLTRSAAKDVLDKSQIKDKSILDLLEKDLADKTKQQKTFATEYVRQQLEYLEQQGRIARQEKIDNDETMDDQTTPSTTATEQGQPTTIDEIKQSPSEETTATPAVSVEEVKPAEQVPGRGETVDEILANEKAAEEAKHAESVQIEEDEAETGAKVERGESIAEEQEIASIRAREERNPVTQEDVEDRKEAARLESVEEVNAEELEIKSNQEQQSITPQSVAQPIEESQLNDEVEEVSPQQEEKVEIEEEKRATQEQKSTNAIAPENKLLPGQHDIQLAQKKNENGETVNGVIIDGNFIDGELIAQMELADYETSQAEIIGETAYANRNPERVSHSSQAISDNKRQKVKHIANTFFYQPYNDQPMTPTVNGQRMIFKDDKGNELPILPGKELAERLLKNGWLKKTKQYYVVGTSEISGEYHPTAIYLAIEDKDGVFLTALRDEPYINREISDERSNLTQQQKQELGAQIESLRAFRTTIVKAYTNGNPSNVPQQARKNVVPESVNISNGTFDNQKDSTNAPIRRKLSEVKVLQIKNDVRSIDQMLLNDELEIGYGTGNVIEFVAEPQVIRKLGSKTELTDTQGLSRSGCLYLIPKPSQTPSGVVAPIQLSIAALGASTTGEIVYHSGNQVGSVAELVYKLLTEQLTLGTQQFTEDLLNILVNHGNKTLVSREVAAKYPFLAGKMLYYNAATQHIQFGYRQNDQRYQLVEFSTVNPSQEKLNRTLNQFATNLHWNTDKEALVQPIPPSVVKYVTAYFNANPNKKECKIAGLDELTFTKEDIGYGGKPVSLLAWMINTGKIQTDLGDNLYKAPFVYANGVDYSGEFSVQPTAVKPVEEQAQPKQQEKKAEQKQEKQEIKEEPKPKAKVLRGSEAEAYIAEYNKKTGGNIKYNGKLSYIIGKGGKPVPVLGRGGLASQQKGSGNVDVDSAKQWLQDKLGLDPTDVLVTEAVMRMANAPEVYGAFQVCLDRLNGLFTPKIYLSEQSGEGVEFHEAFHYVSQLILSQKQRQSLYQELARSDKKYSNISEEEAEEILAEQFRTYELNEQKGDFKYKIKKFFKVLSRILGFNRRDLLRESLFKQIRNGAFKNYKPSQETLEAFHNRFGDGLYYYIPGHTQEELSAIPSITDASTFYKVVDSLNSVVMGYFNINSLEDLKRLPKEIDDIFEVVLQGNLDIGSFDEQTAILIRDVIKNKAVFKKEIENYLRNFSIVKYTAEEQEETRNEEDKPDNTWDKESFTISKKENTALHAKLFFYSIPKLTAVFNEETGQKEYQEALDPLLGVPLTEDFDIVYNKVLENLWNVESYQELVNRCQQYAKFDNFFEAMYEKLTSKYNPITEQQQTEILNTIKSAKNGLTTIMVKKNMAVKEFNNVSDEQLSDVVVNTEEYVKSYEWSVEDSDVFRKIARLPLQWSSRFFLSSLVTTVNGKKVINQAAFREQVFLKHNALQSIFKKKSTKDSYEQASNLFIEICNNLGISMDGLALQNLLYSNYGKVDFDALKKFYQGAGKTKTQTFVQVILNLKTASDNQSSGFVTRSGNSARTFDRIFTSNDVHSQINEMAVAWGKTHPTPEEFSVIGADGNLVYPITENNYMSDQVRWLKTNSNGKRELLKKNAYSSGSLILKSCEIQPETIKLNTYLNLKEDLENSNRDYFGISPTEDYISKMVFGFANHLFCPTMSDKKTWHTISGLKMVFNGKVQNLAIKEFIPSSHARTVFEGEESKVVYDRLQRRFSDKAISIFKTYVQDELNAIIQYYSVRQKIQDNPNLQVKNYFGTKAGNYADGNGGRFRYFGVWNYDGKKHNFNEDLAKAEYEQDWNYIKVILDTAQNILNDKKASDEVVNNLLVSFANAEVRNAINLGIITADLKNKLIPDNILHSKKSGGETNEEKQSIEDTVTDKGVENYEQDLVYSAIACHALNTAMSVIEIEKCFTGDPALYNWQKSLVIYKQDDPNFRPRITETKSVNEYVEKYAKDESDEEKKKYHAYYMTTERAIDKIKRLSSVLSTGTNLRTKFGDTIEMENQTDSKFQVLQLKDYEIGSSVYNELYDLFYTAVAKDVLQKEFNLTDGDALNWVKPESLKASLGRLKKQNPEAYKSIEKKAKVSAKPYAAGEINVADAAVYIRPEFYQRLMRSLGLWNDEIAEAYEIMENEDDWLSDPDKYERAMKAVTQPLKMVYFGDHYDDALGLNINTFDKMALFPLFKTFAKADNKALYERMNDREKGVIDMVAFESAIKVGARARLSYYSDGKVNSQLGQRSDIDGKTGNGLATYTQDLNQIRLQLNTDPHEHLERAFGTQAIKIGFANVVDDREYGANKGLSVKGSQIKKDIVDCIDNLSKIGKQRLKREFFTNGIVDNRKIVTYLQKQATNSGMSQEIISGLTVDENGNINVAIESQSVRDWVESKIVSFVNKLIIDVNTPGGSAIQMSSFAYEAVNRDVSTDPSLVEAFNGGKKLKFLAKEGHMQVLLSERFFKDLLPDELKNAAFTEKRKWLIDNGIIGSKDGVEAKPYGVGYRIPTQGLSSMFSFQVADIMPANIGDAIVVPEEFTAMTGSDFD